ncbi:MAG: DsbA family oxidoreductase [Caulobacteraceae bacterium]
MKTVPIIYFSDVLCVWAYIAQLRLDEAQAQFGEQIAVEKRFCSVFGDTARKMQTQWAAKSGYEGFNAHLRQAVQAFPEVELNPDIWLTVRPSSSVSPHLFLKATQLAEAQGALQPGDSDRLTRALRAAFFAQARDVSDWTMQREVAENAGVALPPVEALIRSGQAFAALASDYQDAEAMHIKGSPSFVLNEGRQKLYGNVGYKIIEANIQELLRDPNPDHASWC